MGVNKNPFDEPDYSDLLEKIAKEYGPKALAILEKISKVLVDDGITIQTPPFDMSADEYRWCLIAKRNPRGKDDAIVDITIEIAEEREYDGGEGYGINFGVDIVEWGGRMLGGLTPYNYTSQCWVDARDPEAVAARWQLIEDSDTDSISSLITEGWDFSKDGYYKEEK